MSKFTYSCDTGHTPPLVFDLMVYLQDETDSIAETESDRTEMKREGDGEREGGAINLTSRPSSAPTTTHTDADNEVNAPFSAQKTYKFTKLGHLKVSFFTNISMHNWSSS